MRTTFTAIAAALLLAPAASAAVRDSGPSASQVAAQICGNLQQQLGASFATKYGSLASCEQQLTSTAQSVVDGCTASGQAGTPAFHQCIQTGIANAVEQITGGGGTPVSVTPSSASVAGDICSDLHTALGNGFASRFGSLAGCSTKLGSSAKSVPHPCAAANQPGTGPFKDCIEAGVKSAVASELAIADKAICASLKKKLGASTFAHRYGSLGHCQSTLKQRQRGHS